MAVQANARALACVSSLEELTQALDYAKNQKLSVLVLGEGSNTIFENDYSGLVILNRLKGIELIDQDDNSYTVRVAAGENWHEFVAYSIQQNWFGIENLALIPLYLNNAECRFSYRESYFKNELAGKVVITAVTFRLAKQAKVNISYPALAACFDEQPSPQQLFDVIIKVRQAKLPLPKTIPNAGSFFKNPIIDQQQHSRLQAQYPDLVSYQTEKGYKLAAGWMIEKAGWKQKQHSGVCVHRQQALVIINPEKKSGKDIIAFAQKIQKDIASKFGVLLEIEPRVHR